MSSNYYDPPSTIASSAGDESTVMSSEGVSENTEQSYDNSYASSSVYGQYGEPGGSSDLEDSVSYPAQPYTGMGYYGSGGMGQPAAGYDSQAGSSAFQTGNQSNTPYSSTWHMPPPPRPTAGAQGNSGGSTGNASTPTKRHHGHRSHHGRSDKRIKQSQSPNVGDPSLWDDSDTGTYTRANDRIATVVFPKLNYPQGQQMGYMYGNPTHAANYGQPAQQGYSQAPASGQNPSQAPMQQTYDDVPANYEQQTQQQGTASSSSDDRVFCQSCPKSYSRYDTLQAHMRQEHPMDEHGLLVPKEKHVCKICYTEFDVLQTLRAHRRSFHRQAPALQTVRGRAVN